MNRYVLFFLLLGIQVSTALPMWKLFQQQQENPVDDFKNKFDQAVDAEHQIYALGLKSVCSNYLENLAKLPYPNEKKQDKLRDLKGEAEFCVGSWAEEKVKEKYEQQTTRYYLFSKLLGKELYDESIQKERGREAREKAINKFRKGTTGKLSYLFYDSNSMHILKKVEDSCGRRLAIGSIWFGLAKNEASRKEQLDSYNKK